MEPVLQSELKPVSLICLFMFSSGRVMLAALCSHSASRSLPYHPNPPDVSLRYELCQLVHIKALLSRRTDGVLPWLATFCLYHVTSRAHLLHLEYTDSCGLVFRIHCSLMFF